jgi:Ca-activated chloride channel homolog
MKEHGKLELGRMSRETGGVSYGVSKNQPIDAIYSEIEEALRSQYSIGYTPTRPSPDGKFHRVKLTTRDRHLVVTTRDGYYAR